MTGRTASSPLPSFGWDGIQRNQSRERLSIPCMIIGGFHAHPRWTDRFALDRAWLHAHRATGGDRDHRRADRPAVARGSGGPRGGPPGPVYEQHATDRDRPPQLSYL